MSESAVRCGGVEEGKATGDVNAMSGLALSLAVSVR